MSLMSRDYNLEISMFLRVEAHLELAGVYLTSTSKYLPSHSL